jgi:hypothetical protein
MLEKRQSQKGSVDRWATDKLAGSRETYQKESPYSYTLTNLRSHLQHSQETYYPSSLVWHLESPGTRSACSSA